MCSGLYLLREVCLYLPRVLVVMAALAREKYGRLPFCSFLVSCLTKLPPLTVGNEYTIYLLIFFVQLS